MNRSEFEPTNGFMLKGRMFKSRDRRRFGKRKVMKRIVAPPQPRVSSVEGQNNGYTEAQTNYPINMDKKIFGMQPKTLAIALGVIVVGILVLSRTNNPQQGVNNGGLQQ